MKRIVIVGFMVLIFAGCATTHPQLSREEWLNLTSRTYEGVTKEQALSAAEQVLRLADGDDFKIFHTDEGFCATRNWVMYLVIAAAAGCDYWQIKALPTQTGVKVSVQINTQSQAMAPMITTDGAWTATTGPMAGSPVQSTSIYDVFWSRMDYILGFRDDWMTCMMADERITQGITWGSNDALCNPFNINDREPGKEPVTIEDYQVK